MKISNENKILIAIASVGAIVTGAVIVKRIKKKKELQAITESKQDAEQQTQQTTAKQVKKIDKILKLGDRGAEVKELQTLLGFRGKDADGRFGNKTLTKLQIIDGGNEISLSEFKRKYPKVNTKTPLGVPSLATTPFVANMATNIVKKKAPLKGEKLLANKPRVGVFASSKRADGKYYNTGKLVKRYAYGEHIGTFFGENLTGKYLIDVKGKIVFTDADNVKAY